MKPGEVLSNGALVVLASCAVILTGLRVRQGMEDRVSEPSAGSSAAAPAAREVPNWQALAAVGQRSGPDSAEVTIVEFADFECPACQRFAAGALPAVLRQYEGRVAFVFRHWPLTYHRFAYPAARAAECAGEQGHFHAFHDAIYAQPDSLGLKPFTEVAREAGVADLQAFESCNRRGGSVPTIERDIAAAKELGSRGTPTIVINGLLLPGVPDSATLVGYVEKALAKTQQ